MEVIFILGASQAFFLSFLVFKKSDKSHGDYVLAAWLTFMGLHLLEFYSHSVGLNLRYPHLLGVGVCFPMLQGPFMFVYILVMINKKGKFKPIYLLNGLPFLLFTIYFFFDFYLLGAVEKLAYYHELEVNFSLALTMTAVLNTYLGPIYVIWSLVLLKRHTKNISKNFSYTEDIDFTWLRYVLIWLAFVWFVVVFADLMDLFAFDETLGDNLIYISLTIAIFFIGYFGIKQQAIYVQKPVPSGTQKSAGLKDIEATNRYKHSGLKKEEAEGHLQELLAYMKDERPYLNGKLSLKEVADYLDISINHLSQVINEQLGKSFFDFVNVYRVEEIKRLLNDSKHKEFTLLALAYDSGFNSKSSFNSIFKKLTDTTPSEYIKSI